MNIFPRYPQVIWFWLNPRLAKSWKEYLENIKHWSIYEWPRLVWFYFYWFILWKRGWDYKRHLKWLDTARYVKDTTSHASAATIDDKNPQYPVYEDFAKNIYKIMSKSQIEAIPDFHSKYQWWNNGIYIYKV